MSQSNILAQQQQQCQGVQEASVGQGMAGGHRKQIRGGKGARPETANKQKGIVKEKDQSKDNTDSNKKAHVPERTLSRNDNPQKSSSTLGIIDSVKVTDPMFKTATNGF